MNISVVKTNKISEVIEKCYQSDTELIEKYHVLAPVSMEKACDHTIKILEQSMRMDMLTMYEMNVDGRFAGYFCREELAGIQLITGFFIMPEFRNSRFVNKFWKIVLSKFVGSIFIYLFEKNTRAIKFVKRRGFKLFDSAFVEQEKQTALILKYN